jgi:hypothetical protein
MSSSMRARLLIPLVGLALAAGGCGGDAGTGPEGAAEAPANATFFVAIDTDFESAQWDNARTLVGKFPDGDRAVDFLLNELSDEGVDFERDVKPALGPEVDIVGFDLAAGESNIVGLTKPQDEEKLRELLEKGDEPVVVRRIGEWTAFAENDEILNRFVDARDEGRLADDEDFQEAMDTVSEDAIVQAYFNGDELMSAASQDSQLSPETFEACVPGGAVPSFAFAVRAESDGVRLEGGGKSADSEANGGYLTPYESQLVDVVPGGLLAYVSFNDLEQLFSTLRDCLATSSPEFERGLGQFEAMLGVSLEEDIAPLFANEGAFYVRRGVPFPEFTLLLSVDDEARAEQTVDDLVAGLGNLIPELGAPEPANIAGVDVKEVRIQDAPLSLFYGAFDGRLVLTTARAGISALREDGERFADDELFQEAKEAADMPDETVGFFFVDLEETVTYVLGFAGVAGEDVPDEVSRNLEPLQHLLVYSADDGETTRLGGFLAID